MECDEYEYVYAPSPYGDRLVSFNGETISYDSSGRTVVYRGKAITYLQADANKIASIGNVSFTYDADGMRRSKTVNGVTHYYTYDGIQLVKEEWGNNVMIFLYDASGSPVGMQYRNSTYAAGVWDIYYYEKNLQGDIVAIYNATGTKLVSYDYDAWGRITSITDGNGNNIRGNASHIGNINPLRYRGYYYDDDLDLYYLATRYYDPEVCRFITADSYVSTGQGILGNNRYAYCNNNPVIYSDHSGHSLSGAVAQACVSVLSYIGIAIASIFDEDIRSDMDAIGWNPFNTDESATLNSNKVSFYKFVPVFKFESEKLSSFSFLGIFLNKKSMDENVLRHEYGHNVQQMLLGPVKYSLGIFAPSAAYNVISREHDSLQELYYSMPWERTAELFGGVIRTPSIPYASYSAEISSMYFLLLMSI